MTEKPLTTGKHYLGKHTCVLRVHAGVSCHMFGMQLTLNVMCPAEMLKGFCSTSFNTSNVIMHNILNYFLFSQNNGACLIFNIMVAV